MRLTPARSVVAALAVVLTLVGCTSGGGEASATAPDVAQPEPEEPAPSIGLRVAVVLPDGGSTDAAVLDAMAADVRRLDATHSPEIAEIRPYRPEQPEFVTDLAWTLADRRTDLICILGRGSRSLVTELAELHPHLSFCAAPLPTNAEVPDTVQLMEVRAEELGYVVGVAAAAAADGGTIGVVLGTDTKPRGAFKDGITAAIGQADHVQVTVDEEVDALTAVEQVLAAGAEVVVMDSVAGAAAALELAAEQALVLSPDVLARGVVADRAVLTWRVRWDVVLERAIEHLLGEVPSTPTSYGFREEVFIVSSEAASTPGLRSTVARTVEDLEARVFDPLEPPPDPVPDDTP